MTKKEIVRQISERIHETQLKTKTWAELGKWYHMFLAREHFKLTATAIFSSDPGLSFATIKPRFTIIATPCGRANCDPA